MTNRTAMLLLPLATLSFGCGGCGGCGGGGDKGLTIADAQALVQSKFPGSPVRHTKTKDGDAVTPTRYEFEVGYRSGTQVSVSVGGDTAIRGPVPLDLVPDRFRRDARVLLKVQELSGASMHQSDQLLNLSHEATYSLVAKLDGENDASVGFNSGGRVVSATGVPYPWDKVTPALIAKADEKHRRNPLHVAATWSSAQWSRRPEDLLRKGGDRLTLQGTSARGNRVSVDIDIEERPREELGLPPLAP